MIFSPNFSLLEAVKSQTALRMGIDNTPSPAQIESLRQVALNILQPVRDHYRTPFSPSSWFRSPALNAAIGSRPTSQHIRGEAADFEVPGVRNTDLARWIAVNLDFDQLILEFWSPTDPAAGWVHCSYVAGPGRNRRSVLKFDGNAFTQGLPA